MTKKEMFDLKKWYASEDAKRSFGSICRAVNDRGQATTILGSSDRPYLILKDADDVPLEPWHISMSIDAMKADWSNVVIAAIHYGAVFRIQGKLKERAVLFAHPDNKPPARKYSRAKLGPLGDVTSKLEAVLDELRELATKLDRSADVFLRRTREIWRQDNGYRNQISAQN